MRVIYRSASKRQLTSSSSSLTQEVLNRWRFYIPWVFFQLGVIRSSFCQFLFCGLAWVAVSSSVLPWVGLLVIACQLWRKKAVPWLFRRLTLPCDLPEYASNVGGINSGLSHILVQVEGPVNLQLIENQVCRFLHRDSDGNKLKRTLIHIGYGIWAWRENSEAFRIENHVTLCEEVWNGKPLNNQSLKYRVNELCGINLDERYSPWHIYVVPFVQKDTRTDCHALFIRAHHLVAHLFRVEDFGQDNSDERVLRNALSVALSNYEEEEERLSESPQSESVKRNLVETIQQLLFILKLIWQAPAVILYEFLRCARYLAKSRIITGYKSKRAVYWSDPISKDLISRLKEASGAESFDSVLLTCFAGAIHHYQKISGKTVIRSDAIRSLINLNGEVVTAFLPTGDCCPKTRVLRVKRSLLRGITDIRYTLGKVLFKSSRRLLPSWLLTVLSDLLALGSPVMVDIVKVEAIDSSIVEVNHWKPYQFHFGLTVTFLQYGDKVSVCVMSEYETLPRPDVLVSCFGRAVLDMALAFNVRYERKPSPPSTPTKAF